MEYKYRDGFDTKACFIATALSFDFRPTPKDIFGDKGSLVQLYFQKDEMLSSVPLGMKIIGAHIYINQDNGFIYAYNIEKHKSKWTRAYPNKPPYTNPNPYVKTQESRWDVTIYRIPKKNVLSFTQHPSHFKMRYLDDEQIAFRAKLERGVS